ncbi:MAG: FMN-binding glutamate synthase family protein, partial [Gemmatimonadota bacterium]|nr:FMN-binding glutamate synthase family protein [Gemmatimonadota bacterium]
KLSQGAKPGIGGILPGAKVTKDIAAARGVPVHTDCISPAKHSAFHDADSLLDFVEDIAETTGLPVGIKSAVGDLSLWHDLAVNMASGSRGIDFLTIDGGEGGTGAGPLVFADHVALPFRLAFSRVYKIFAEHGITERIVFNGSGKLGFPETAMVAFALGCDMVSVAREPLLAIGCIQSQKCHTGHCPTGITTHNRWLVRGLDPTLKSVRLAHYMITLRKEIVRLSHAMGVSHPSLATTESIEILNGDMQSRSLAEISGYGNGTKHISETTRRETNRLMENPA